MSYFKYKCSAIHNLIITKKSEQVNGSNLNEGIVIPKNIMEKADIFDGEEIIITKIGAGSWKNRLRTFIIEGEENCDVEVRGSIAKFLDVGDLTCLITEMYLDDDQFNQYKNDEIPIFDLGFDPETNKDNSESCLDIQYLGRKIKDVKINDKIVEDAKTIRKNIQKMFLEAIVTNLQITKTHPDCLQGSAELPRSVMDKIGISQYKSVSVYNMTYGGVADTYAVPMPEGVVMTTGAMASFANIGEKVSVASYIMSKEKNKIRKYDATEYMKKYI